jgi:predicted Zn-dependent peptidase
MDVDVSKTYSYVAFIIEHDQLDVVFDWLLNALKNVSIDDVTLNQLKRRYLGMSLKALNKPSSLSKQMIRYALNDLDFFDVLNLFQSMSMSDIEEAQQILREGLSHHSRVKILPMH